MFFGQVFRCAGTAVNGLFTIVSIQNQIAKNYSRKNSTLMSVIIGSLVINVGLFLLFYFLPIAQVFSIKTISVSEALLYSAISGFGQTLTEVAITENLIESNYLILIVLPIFKLIELFAGSSYV